MVYLYSIKLFCPTCLSINLNLISLLTKFLAIKRWYGILWINCWNASPFNQALSTCLDNHTELLTLSSSCQLSHSRYIYFLEQLLILARKNVHYLDIAVYWNYYYYHYSKTITFVDDANNFILLQLLCSSTFWNSTCDKNARDQNTGSFGADYYLHDFTINS